jgi:hypothetical protein
LEDPPLSHPSQKRTPKATLLGETAARICDEGSYPAMIRSREALAEASVERIHCPRRCFCG